MGYAGATACAAAVLLLLPIPQAPAATDWSKFDPPSLTIIYPEQKALSNPPFLHCRGTRTRRKTWYGFPGREENGAGPPGGIF